MIYKDLNLFLVFKQNAPKIAGRGGKGIVLCIIAFVLVVGLAFGGLTFYRRMLEGQTSALRGRLSDAEVAKATQRLAQERRRTELLRKYYTAVLAAAERFGASRHIDPKLLRAMTDAMPEDVTLTSFTVTPTSAVLTCQASRFLSSAMFAQALEQNELFASVVYENVLRADSGVYTFSITCTFADAKEEAK